MAMKLVLRVQAATTLLSLGWVSRGGGLPLRWSAPDFRPFSIALAPGRILLVGKAN